MPNFVERLCHVEENRRAQFLVFEAFSNLMNYSMRLVDGRVTGTEAELVVGDKGWEIDVPA
jgi:hypothetical protein